VIKEVYPLHRYLPREIPDVQFEVFTAGKQKSWFSGPFHWTTRHNNSDKLQFCFFAVKTSNYASS